MNETNNFSSFMTSVITRANEISLEKSGRTLEENYRAPSSILKMINSVLKAGWTPYTALVKLLSNASYFTFAAALAVFIVTPIGAVVIAALVYWGGADSIKTIYCHKRIALDVEKIGQQYQTNINETTAQEETNRKIEEAALNLYNLSQQ